jgi:hypothetical protein
MEQERNRNVLTSPLSVYTNSPCMGRPPKPESERRSKLFPLRLTHGEIAELESAARRLDVTVAEIFRRGAQLYIERSKDGSKRKEKKH